MDADAVIAMVGPEFDDWTTLLRLLHAAFAYQKDRIDPPSSLHALDQVSLAQKASDERLILATINDEIVGCVFAKTLPDRVYLGKLAVWPHLQRSGIGSLLMRAVEALAKGQGRSVLELDTRIELIENHETFSKLGFSKVSESAHPGYDRPTFITMQKQLLP